MSQAPPALDWSAENCTIGRAMAILGEKWTMVVLREVFNGIRRFDDMRARTGIPRQVLTNRLSSLVEQGILRRVPYREPGARERHEYRLTDKGLGLWRGVAALRVSGDPSPGAPRAGGATGISPPLGVRRCAPCTVAARPRCAPNFTAPPGTGSPGAGTS